MLELQVIRLGDFIRVSSHGKVEFESSKDALRKLAKACRTRGTYRAVLDLRGLQIPEQPYLTPSEVAALVETFGEVGLPKSFRLAVIYKADPHRGVRTFAFLSHIRGYNVRAFSDFEPALFWITADVRHVTGSNGEGIPIQFENEDHPLAAKVQNPTKKPPGLQPLSGTKN